MAHQPFIPNLINQRARSGALLGLRLIWLKLALVVSVLGHLPFSKALITSHVPNSTAFRYFERTN